MLLLYALTSAYDTCHQEGTMPSASEHARGLSRTVAVANGKGGAFKTSVSSGLAGLAAAAGMRVLLVDLDQQGNLTEDLGLGESTDHGMSLFAGLTGPQVLTPQPTGREHLDIVYGGHTLKELAGLPWTTDNADDWPYRLADALAPLDQDYDLIILDCPPSTGAVLTMACVAARYVLIPTRSDTSSLRGLRAIADHFLDARPRNPNLTLLGVVLAGIGRASTRIRRETRQAVDLDLGGSAPVFQSVIRYAESPANQVRSRGRLPHELESDLQDQETSRPWWKSLRERLSGGGGADTLRLPPTASGLAEDYATLTQEVFAAIAAHETNGGMTPP